MGGAFDELPAGRAGQAALQEARVAIMASAIRLPPVWPTLMPKLPMKLSMCAPC